MLAVIDFSSASTRPVPYPYLDTFCFETAREDAHCTDNAGYMTFHWDTVEWFINREASPKGDPLPPIGEVELL